MDIVIICAWLVVLNVMVARQQFLIVEMDRALDRVRDVIENAESEDE